MKVSLNTIKQYVDFELPPVDELVERINQQLGVVEEVIDLSDKYKDAVIVRVVECEKHPDADRLSVCKVDAGEDDYVQVVCGAPNVHADMWAVWLPPKSTVPASYGDEKPLVLSARALRGVMSNGMLAAGDELGLNSDHDGIIEVADDDLPAGAKLTPGAKFAELFGLDDTVIDIENKMFTHRPDLFGQLGVAREIAAILGDVPHETDTQDDRSFKNPSWYGDAIRFDTPDDTKLHVFNEAGEGAPRFMTVVMDDVEIKPSPLWLQCELVRWGSKSINNVVDLTNYVMLITAQPTHAYDYDKLHDATLGVRMAKSGETATLLNGKTYKLDESDIVIADGKGVVGLAGIMGGGESEVSESTKTVALEVATFDMYAVRRSGMRHGLFTDALTRFNKGQSKLQNGRVLFELVSKMKELVGAKQVSDVYDARNFSIDTDMSSLSGPLHVDTQFINARLGTSLIPDQIRQILERTNFMVKMNEVDDKQLTITAPFWRTDIAIAEDIVEEVGRLCGYEQLPRQLPTRSTKPAPMNHRRVLKQSLRQSFRAIGANEALTYSFVHKAVLENAKQNPDNALKLTNALSPDLQYYRLSVLPSLLDKVRSNSKAGYDEFVLYEIGKGHEKGRVDDDTIPLARDMLDAVYAAKHPDDNAAFYHVRHMMDAVANDLNIPVQYEPVETSDDARLAPFDAARTAVVKAWGTTTIGWIGELHQDVIKRFKLPKAVAGLSLDIDVLLGVTKKVVSRYQPLSRFPSLTQDISLVVAPDVLYGDVLQTVTSAVQDGSAKSESVHVSALSLYQSKDADKKTITFRIKVTSFEKTLTEKRVTNLLKRVEMAAEKHHDASRG